MVAALLQETGFEVIGADMNDTDGMTFPVKKINITNSFDYKIISEFDAVIFCLPYNFNIGLAAAAHESGIHYFDLTEDVKTTKAIIQMSDTARAVMAPQCGLAPGFIAIVGADLARIFDQARSIRPAFLDTRSTGRPKAW